MGIIIEVNGNSYQNFKSISVIRSMETLSGAFNAIATINQFKDFPLKLGDSVRVIINNIPVLTGFIETMRPSYSNDSHEIEINGRDKTCDVIDSSSIQPINFQPKISLKDVVLKVLNQNNIKSKLISESESLRGFKENFIGIIDLASPNLFDDGDIIGAEVGEGLFDIIDKYCAKRQVLATTDGNGNIVLTRGSENEIESKLIHRHTPIDKRFLSNFNDINKVKESLIIPKTRENNIISASANFSNESRFNKYIVRSQSNLSSLNLILSTIDANSSINQKGESIDSSIRSTRSMVIPSDTSNNESSAKDRAIWEANIRRVRSFTYNCTVQGFDSDNGQLWSPNNLVQVEDEKLDVNGLLLIKSVKNTFSLNGSLTEMEMSYPDSFTLEAEQKVLEARKNTFGNDILSLL